MCVYVYIEACRCGFEVQKCGKNRVIYTNKYMHAFICMHAWVIIDACESNAALMYKNVKNSLNCATFTQRHTYIHAYGQ